MFQKVVMYVLLLSYLLVTGVTNVTTVLAVKYTHGYSATKPFVHAPDCQHRFYLQVDCFDKCTTVAETNHPEEAPVLLQATGFDFHTATWLRPATTMLSAAAAQHPLLHNASVSAGFTTICSPPPIFS